MYLYLNVTIDNVYISKGFEVDVNISATYICVHLSLESLPSNCAVELTLQNMMSGIL